MIEVKYIGRLGNNLFQYCIGKILAEKLGYQLKADPILGFPNIKNITKGKDYSKYPVQRLTGHVIDIESIINDNRKRKIIIDGFFQNYKYYAKYKNIIKNNWIKIEPSHEKNNPNDIVVGVRRGDCVIGNHALPFSFYVDVLNKCKYDKVHICTDYPDDDFVLKLAKIFDANIRKNTPLEDFKFIMASNKIIISCSTLHWWAAWLSNADEIYFPIPLSGHWSKIEDHDINLEVDEKRYTYIKCKERYKKTFKETLRVWKFNYTRMKNALSWFKRYSLS